jgi:phage protein D
MIDTRIPAVDVSSPIFTVSVLDQSNNEELVRPEDVELYSVRYTDSDKRADKAVLTVNNFDLANFDNPIWKKGNRVRLAWGYPGRMTVARECVIRKVSGFTKLQVEANGLEVILNRVTVSKTFENMTVTSIVEEIAESHGYGSTARYVQTFDEVKEFVVQGGLTDAQFLVRLAHQNGCQFYIDHDGFHFHERFLNQKAYRELTYYTDNIRSEVLSISLKNDVSSLPGRVRVRRRDPINREDVEASADNAADPNRPSTGGYIMIPDPDVAAYTHQLLVSNEKTVQGSGSGGGNGDATSASNEARARFRRAQQQAAKMSVRLIGDPNIYAKSVVKMSGLGQRLSGNYYVKEAVHEITLQGYTTTLSLIKDAVGDYARRYDVKDGMLPEVALERSTGNSELADRKSKEKEIDEQKHRKGLVPIGIVHEDEEHVTTRFIRPTTRETLTQGGRPSNPASTAGAMAGREDA